MAQENRVVRAAGRNKKAICSSVSSVNVPITELEDIRQWIQKEKLGDQFNLLPPDCDYTFGNLERDLFVEAEGRVSSLSLFVGEETKSINYQPVLVETWATLETFPEKNKMTKPILMKFNNKTRKWKRVTHFDEFHLMYPFQVFKESKGHGALNQFYAFIAYIFLECGHEDGVFFNKLSESKTLLKAAIGKISEKYAKRGIENIPDLERPEINNPHVSRSKAKDSNAPQQTGQQASLDHEEPGIFFPERSPSVAEEEEDTEPHQRIEQPRYNTRSLIKVVDAPASLSDHESQAATSHISAALSNIDLSGPSRARARRKRARDREDDYEVAKRLRLEQQRDDLEKRDQLRRIAMARDKLDLIEYRGPGRKAALKQRLERLSHHQLVGLILDEDDDDDEVEQYGEEAEE